MGDYFTAQKTDWVNARRIINGTDKAQTIADYARAFYAALPADVRTVNSEWSFCRHRENDFIRAT